jgi:hypothetical protein
MAADDNRGITFIQVKDTLELKKPKAWPQEVLGEYRLSIR